MRRTLTGSTLSALLLAGCSQGDATPADPTSATAGRSAPSAASESPSPPAASCPNPEGGTCLGPLEPGRYRTSTFQPGITYTVPAGWTNFEDLPGNFWLFRQEDPQHGTIGGSYLGIYQNVRAAAIDCADLPQQGVGATPSDLVGWYESVPGLVVSEPRPVEIGGLEGFQIDLALKPGVDTCSYGPYDGIPLIIGGGISGLHHVILGEFDVRLVILSWKNGNVTLEITNVKDQHTADEYRAQLQPIIDTLNFDT